MNEKQFITNKTLSNFSHRKFEKMVEKILSGEIECVNHPFFSDRTVEKIIQKEGIVFMEKNTKCCCLLIDNEVIDLPDGCLCSLNKTPNRKVFENLGQKVYEALAEKQINLKTGDFYSHIVVRLGVRNEKTV